MEFNNISFIRVPKTGSCSILSCWSPKNINEQPRDKPPLFNHQPMSRIMLTNKSDYAKKYFNSIRRDKIFYYASGNNLKVLELQNKLFKIKKNKIFNF